MAFPQTPLSVRVRIAPGADPGANAATWSQYWTDVTADVRVESGIDITVGRADEGKAVDASKCTLTLNNKGGRYSTRNPLSPWYGLLGINTPLDVSIPRTITDSLRRSVASGWGATPDGDQWVTLQIDSGGGSLVTAAGAQHQQATTNTYRYSYLPNAAASDVDAYATCSVDRLAVGGDIEALGFMLRVTDVQAYYLHRVKITPAGAVVAVVYDRSGNVLGQATLAGVTYTAGLALRGRAQAVGSALRFKVWLAGQAEPAAWLIDVTDSGYVGGGGLGLRSGVAAGNTSTKPITLTYTDFTASIWCTRFLGTVPEWPPRWDKSGKDSYSPLAAAGIIRRLSQGQSPLRSVMFRSTVAAGPVAYWSLEDEATSGAFAEALGRAPMTWVGSAPKRGSSAAPGSAPLPQLAADTVLTAPVEFYTPTTPGTWAVQLAFKLPDEQGQDVPIIDVYTDGGTYRMWRLWYGYGYGPGIFWRGYDWAGNSTSDLIISNLGLTFTDGKIGGHDMIVGFSVAQSGANIVLDAYQHSPDDRALVEPRNGTYRALGSTTLTGATNGKVIQVVVPFSTGYPHTNWTMGHIMVMGRHFDVFSRQMLGFTGEQAANRIARLCDEQGIPLVSYWQNASTEMGAQGVDTFLGLLRECEAADGGILHEAGGGFGYMSRQARYNRDPVLQLDFSRGDIAEPPEPTDDDLALRNDVTAQRTNGGSTRYIDTTSAHAVQRVGRYDEQVTINVYSDADLPQQAAWRVHLGTLDEPRWPRLDLNLASRQGVPLIPAWLGCQVGLRLQVANPPAGIAPEAIAQIVEGWTEHLNVFDWRAMLNCAPAAAYDVFTLDTDRLDADPSSQLVADITATATSFQVSNNGQLGAPWTTDPAEWTAPKALYLNVAGEQMRVTNIVGAASPQTFTVVRAVNGISKAQKAGARVGLWKPRVLAL